MSLMSDCGPFKFSAKLKDESLLPNFIKFDANTASIKIFTPISKDAKDYQIIVRGTSEYYDPSSSISSAFTVKVSCKPKKLAAQDSQIEETFLFGSPFPLQIKLKPFIITPSCKDSNIQYQASLISGERLPSFIAYDSSKNTLTVSDNGQLDLGTYDIQLTGSIGQNLKAILPITIKVVLGNSPNGVFEDMYMLDPINIDLTANQKSPKTFYSQDFIRITKQPYSLLIQDQSLVFISFIPAFQQLIFDPKTIDEGSHQVYLLSETDDKSKNIAQLLSIKVKSDGNQVKQIDGIISEITKAGVVIIDFNQKLVVPSDGQSKYDSNSLNLIIQNKDGVPNSNVNFDWKYLTFTENLPSGATSEKNYQGSRMTLQMIFQDPLSISIGVRSTSLNIIQEYDYLNVRVLNCTLFKSKSTGMMIPFRYKMTKKIPKQLDSSSSSKYLDKFSTMVQTGINIIASSSTIIQFSLQGDICTYLFQCVCNEPPLGDDQIYLDNSDVPSDPR